MGQIHLFLTVHEQELSPSDLLQKPCFVLSVLYRELVATVQCQPQMMFLTAADIGKLRLNLSFPRFFTCPHLRVRIAGTQLSRVVTGAPAAASRINFRLLTKRWCN